jgi:small subunit ribosomal protein S21
MFVNNRGGFKRGFGNKTQSDEPQRTGGTTVEVRNNDVNKALRKLKKKLQADNTLQEYRDRQYFIKPSEKRRLAKKAGVKRWKKKQRELESEWGTSKKRMY